MNHDSLAIDQVTLRAVRDLDYYVGGTNPDAVIALLDILEVTAPPASELRHHAARGANLIRAKQACSWDEPFVLSAGDQRRMGFEEPIQ